MENKMGENVKIYRDVIIKSSDIGDNCTIGDDVYIANSKLGMYCRIDRRGMIYDTQMGDYSYTTFNTVVRRARIGKYCSISWNVSIGGYDHEYRRMTQHPFPYDIIYGGFEKTVGGGCSSGNLKLTIGNDVWVASNACILRGVEIGDGAVIGAGAVVTHDVGPYEIWAGVPAKKIGQRFTDEIIDEMVKLKWWDLSRETISKNIEIFEDDNITIEKIKEFEEKIK